MEKFDTKQSIAARQGHNSKNTIAVIAQNYIAMNPIEPFSFHAVSASGFYQEPDGRYYMDMAERFPKAAEGVYCYIAGRFCLENPVRQLIMAVNCFGPTAVWLNGTMVYQSQCLEEVNRNVKKTFSVSLQAGENLFVIRVRKVRSGFGCIFGAEKDLADPKRYSFPWHGKQEVMGFSWSEPVASPLTEEEMPVSGMKEEETGLRWYPRTAWSEEERKLPQMERMFGIQPGRYAYAMTRFHTGFCSEKAEVILRGICYSPCTLWIDGEKIWTGTAEEFALTLSLAYGTHVLLVESVCGEEKFGFDYEISDSGGHRCRMENPYHVKGTESPWVYLGALKEPVNDKALRQTYLVHQKKFWRLDMPEMNLRPYIVASRYGRWTYPLGVTLYGLYRAGKLLNRQEFSEYAAEHIRLCVQWYSYALWDKETYGYPTVNPKLVHMKMLDDCGSCGSTMLEMYFDGAEPQMRELADEIADFMTNRMERQPDGAFYRLQQGVHYQTLWADDLYMATPFLARYARMTHSAEYLDDAAQQFLLFRKYLYMKEYGLMSHVYNFDYGVQNGQPWGRGNGWVMFSLTELLEKLPKKHPKYAELLRFFREMSRGVLQVQGENGLWHQILTDKEAYEETSCTAMFTYAFCRGIRLGLYESCEEEQYYHAAAKAWKGIEERAVDTRGNVYGVCWGSQYSFQADYYTKKLLWAPNDTHGIGIVMLAGTEFELLEEYLRKGAEK